MTLLPLTVDSSFMATLVTLFFRIDSYFSREDELISLKNGNLLKKSRVVNLALWGQFLDIVI